MPFCEKMVSNNSSGTILFKDKQIRIILALADKSKEWHLVDLAAAAQATYVHTSKFISRCQELGIVRFDKHGKKKNLYLTDKGVEIAQSISSIMDRINVKKVEDAPLAPNNVAKPA